MKQWRPRILDSHSAMQELVTYPSSFEKKSGDKYKIVLAEAPFKAWCNSDATCSSSSTVDLSLSTTAIAQVNASITNWPSYITSDGSSYLSYDIISKHLLDFQITGLSSKSAGSPICSSQTTCTASLDLAVTLQPIYGTTSSFLCLLLKPDPSNSSAYLIVGGYPDLVNGIKASTSVVQEVFSCNTSYVGQYLVVQYLRPSPPPSPFPPPSPPPPPPMPTPTGLPAVSLGSASLSFQAQFSLSFDELAANSTLLSNFTSDLPYWLAIHLGALYPSYFVDQSNNLPYYKRVNITVISRAATAGVVSVTFKLLMSAGVTSAQMANLALFINNSTPPTLFLGSAYLSLAQEPFIVTNIDMGPSSGLTIAQVIIIGSVCGSVILLVAAVVSFIMWWKRLDAILPKKEDEERDRADDEAEEERRREKRKKRRSKAAADEAVKEGLQLEQDPPSVYAGEDETRSLMGGDQQQPLGYMPAQQGYIQQPQMMPNRAFVPMPLPSYQQQPVYAVGPNGQPMMMMPPQQMQQPMMMMPPQQMQQQQPMMVMGPNGQPMMVMPQPMMY